MAIPKRPNRSIKAMEGLLEPPKYFDEARIDKYYAVGSEVLKMRILERSDYDAFCILIDSLVSYDEASALLIQEGMMVKGREGTMVKHPASSMKNVAFQIIQPLMIQFGLTPSARASMGIKQSAEMTEVDKFLKDL